jgi:hypothetical protein
LVPVEDQSTSYFLGPVGISDPSEFITAGSQRIPFKASLSKPHEWQDAFKNWPLPPIAGWRNWYKRMLDDDSAKTSNWDSLRIAHYLELSLAETPENKNLLIVACHFWSNGANAFLFGHGPMSPILANLYMITGLGVAGIVYPHKYMGSSRQTRVRTGVVYKRYIQNYMSDGHLSEVEYRAFLNMWLCRFIFCGKANEPTLNHIVMVEDLAAGTSIPLGKYLLGSVYHMLRQTTYLMHTSQKKIHVLMALGGLFRCGSNYICTRLLLLTSTIDTSLQPITRKGKPRAPKVAKLMERLPPLCPSTKALVNSLSSSSEVLPTLFGFHIWTMPI